MSSNIPVSSNDPIISFDSSPSESFHTDDSCNSYEANNDEKNVSVIIINDKYNCANSEKILKQPHININECLWAVNYPEIQKACYLARVCTISPPKYCRLKNIVSIIQDGPTCGLTALSMLFNGQPTSNELLEVAKSRNYTHNGEMFSARNLYQLTSDISSEIDKKIKCELYEGHLNCAKVKNDLKNDEACIFVPYDPDFNHGPCLKFGHKAHWALIIGYLIDDKNNFYVISRHGKTRNIAVWPLNALSASNANLVEFEQPKGYPNMDFILPDGGIGGKMGLKNQSIIVKGLSIETINIL